MSVGPFVPRDVMHRQLCASTRGMASWESRKSPDGAIILSEFLKHTAETVSHYDNLKNLRSATEMLKLEDFPLTSRSEIAANLTDYLSSTFPMDDLVWTSTSGTTGVPLRIPRDLGSIYGVFHDTYFKVFGLIPGLLGELVAHRTAIIVLDDVPHRYPPATVVQPVLAKTLLQRVVIGTSESDDRRIVEDLRLEKIPLLYGRPRSLRRLREIEEEECEGARIRPFAILSSGDNLYESDRVSLESWFGCPVFNAYGSQESGVVGLECSNQNGVHLWNDRCVVEILNEDQTVSSIGSGELVLTNLANWALPFVRYKTGDFVRIEVGACKCGYVGQTLREIAGRDSVYFRLNNKRFNPSQLDAIFESRPVLQYQIRQYPNECIEITWVADRRFETSALESEMNEHLKRIIKGVEVRWVRADRIGAPGEKVQRFVTV